MNELAPPKNVDETLTRVRALLPSLAKRMRQCGEFIAEHHDQIAFSTVADIAARAEVQPSAFMRFCNQLGFQGYSDMQKLFRKEVNKTAPDYSTRVKNMQEKGRLTPTSLLAEFVEAGRFSLEKMLHEISETELEKAVKTLSEASLIHIVGYRRAFPVASCLSYTFEKLDVPSIFHDDIGKVSKPNSIREGDVVIAITFAPYTAGTVEVAEQAIARGAKVVAITDTEFSPVNIEGVTLLKVVDVDVGDFRSLSASINLAMTLAVAVGAARD